MTRLVAWCRAFLAAFRLARRIQRGELVAVRPDLLVPHVIERVVRVPSAPEPPPALPPAVEPVASPAPHDPSGRYEVRTDRDGTYHTKLRTHDVHAAKAVFAQSYTVPVELYDHALHLVRARKA